MRKEFNLQLNVEDVKAHYFHHTIFVSFGHAIADFYTRG